MARSRGEKLEVYAALVDATPAVDLKGKSTRYTSLNRNMFSFLSPDGVLAFRLSGQDRASYLDLASDAVVVQHGAVMKDYVAITDAVMDASAALAEMWEACLANARTLRPKPTKRKRI